MRTLLCCCLILAALPGRSQADQDSPNFSTVLAETLQLVPEADQEKIEMGLEKSLALAEKRADSLHIYFQLANRLRRYTPFQQWALELLSKAIHLNLPEELDSGKAFMARALIHNTRGQYESAIQDYQEAIQIMDSLEADSVLRAACYHSIGKGYIRRGDYPKAQNYLRQSIRLDASGRYMARNLNEIGNQYAYQDQHTRAIASYDSARLYLAPESELYAIIQGNAGDSYRLLGQFDQAIQYIEAAIDQFKKLQSWDHLVQMMLSRGNLALDQGKKEAAKGYFQEALDYAQKAYGQEARRERGKVHIAIGKLALQEQDYNAALEAFHLAICSVIPEMDSADIGRIPHKEQLFLENILHQSLYGKGQAFYQRFQAQNDSLDILRGLMAYDAMREVEDLLRFSFDYESAKLFLALDIHRRAEEVIEWLCLAYETQGERELIQRAFEFAERSKSMVLLEQLIRSENANRTHFDSLYLRLTDFDRIKPDSIQASLAANEALLSFFVGERQVYVFYFDQKQIHMQALMPATALHEQLNQIHGLLLQPSSPTADLNKRSFSLAQTLLQPLAKNPDIQYLTVIPDGMLNHLPFEVLRWQQGAADSQYLIEHMAISYQYSAMLRDKLWQKGPELYQGEFLGIAPEIGEDLPPLFEHESEVQELTQILGVGEVLLGAQATKAAFLSQKHPFRMLHLSTHASANSQENGAPWIHFAGPVGDSRLYLDELYKQNLQANLVVLSSCESGTGAIVEGEGIMSLSRGFVFAGCQSIVATMWKTDERVSKEVLHAFYQYLKEGHNKARALQLARLDYLQGEQGKQWKHPHFWAGFQLLGNTDPVFEDSALSTMWWMIPLILMVMYFMFNYVRTQKNSEKESH